MKKVIKNTYNNIVEIYRSDRVLDSPDFYQMVYKSIQNTIELNGLQILDMGCGNGVPLANMLAQENHYSGIDISDEQVKKARMLHPKANFYVADFETSLNNFNRGYDLILAIYSIIHSDRNKHGDILEGIWSRLKKHGILAATLGYNDCPNRIIDNWFGHSMFFSHYDWTYYENLFNSFGGKLIQMIPINGFVSKYSYCIYKKLT